MARMQRICVPIPAPVGSSGSNICYGDFGAKHIIEPVDASRMVDTANALARAIKRPLTYIHFPIPILWREDVYYRPFQRLRLAADTVSFLASYTFLIAPMTRAIGSILLASTFPSSA